MKSEATQFIPSNSDLPPLPLLKCTYQNHTSLLQLICLNNHCIQQSNELICAECCHQTHSGHKQCVIALKVVISELLKSENEDSQNEYRALRMLLNGLRNVNDQKSYRLRISQIFLLAIAKPKLQKILNKTVRQNYQQTKSFYNEKTNNLSNKHKTALVKNSIAIINPIISFRKQKNLILETPFCIRSQTNQLLTALAYPSLSQYYQNIEVNVKIQKSTPSWLGIGLAVGQSNYEQDSKSHILAISNGFISQMGIMHKTNLCFKAGNTVSVCWNRDKKLIVFKAGINKHIVRFQDRWDTDVYFCVCMFYRNDQVCILA